MSANSTTRSIVPGVAAAWDLSDVSDFENAWSAARPAGIEEAEEETDEVVKQRAEAAAEKEKLRLQSIAEEEKRVAEEIEKKRLDDAIKSENPDDFGGLFNTSL